MFIGGLEAEPLFEGVVNELVQSRISSPIVHSARQLFNVHLRKTGPSDFSTAVSQLLEHLRTSNKIYIGA